MVRGIPAELAALKANIPFWSPSQQALSENGAVFAAAYACRTGGDRLVLWDVTSGKTLHTLNAQSDVRGICITPDGKTLAVERTCVPSRGPTYLGIDIWDVASGQKRGKTLPIDDTNIAGMAWAPTTTRSYGRPTGHRPTIRW